MIRSLGNRIFQLCDGQEELRAHVGRSLAGAVGPGLFNNLFMTRRGGGVILRTASQPAFFFRKMMQNTAKILENFEKIMQKIVNCSNCLQFPEIPAKFREKFTEKLRFQLIFGNLLKKYAKITKICENLKILKCKRCKSLLVM